MKECGKNSRFTLLKTNSKSTSLEIVPEHHSNIARFLNSANFDEVDGDERGLRNNVSVFRGNLKGKVVAVMFTNRETQVGEELKWDYGVKY